jgi:hypothetical protein
MQQMIRINGIEARAKQYNLTLAAACELASVPTSTVFRWRKGESDPHMKKFENVCLKLDKALDQVRDRLAAVAQSDGAPQNHVAEDTKLLDVEQAKLRTELGPAQEGAAA